MLKQEKYKHILLRSKPITSFVSSNLSAPISHTIDYAHEISNIEGFHVFLPWLPHLIACFQGEKGNL